MANYKPLPFGLTIKSSSIQGLGVFTRAGIMTRPERVVLLGIGMLADQIEWFLLAIAVVSCVTLFQRMFTIRDMLNEENSRDSSRDS